MKNFIKYIVLVIGIFLFQNAWSQTPGIEDIVKGKIRVKLKKEILSQVHTTKSATLGTSDTNWGISALDDVNAQVGITRIQRVFPFSIKNEQKHRKHGLHLWFELDFDPSLDPTKVVEYYNIVENVEIVKPLYKKVQYGAQQKPFEVKLDTIFSKGKMGMATANLKSAVAISFNDPRLPEQWHYENDGTIGTENVDIDLEQAWQKATGTPNIIVAIVDGGIDTEHEDLKRNIWVNEVEADGEPGVDDDNNGYVDDIHGYNFVFGGAVTPHSHGTHVAGTVGAVSNNETGVAGIAGGDGTEESGVRMMSCQIYDTRAQQGGNFAAAIVYGADNGAVISQNSWGYTTPGHYEPEVLDAIDYFIEEAGQYEGSPMNGGIVIFAAGNSGRNHEHYPAAYESTLAVAALGPEGYNAPYSTHGPWVDISAPGGDQVNFGQNGGVLSTIPGNKYGFMQGTSMACPHVSGVAALVLSKFGNAAYTPDQLRATLLNSVIGHDFEHEDNYGIGALNASNALADDESIAPDVITDLEAPEISYNEILLEWTVPKDSDDYQPRFFHLAVSVENITEQNFNDQPFIMNFTNPYEAGEKVSIRLSGFQKLTDYYFAIKSSDQFQNTSLISNILKVTTTDAPQLKESTRLLSYYIDVREGAKESQNLEITNAGEGILNWNSMTVNENEYWTDYADWEEQADISNEASLNSAGPSNVSTFPMSTTKSAQIDEDNFEHWKNDNTAFRGGYSYTNEWGGLELVGAGNPNAGLIYATYFPEAINLTHLEVGMVPLQNEKPVLVEIRKGSDKLELAEQIYFQEYHADTTEVFKYYRIPLYRPQLIKEGEGFWVVLHFPKEEIAPLVVQRAEYMPDIFKISGDNGVTFSEAWKLINGNRVPLLNALTTGNDGSFVFVDPMFGAVKAGETDMAKIIVDATNLKNGKHLATVSIFSNDVNKPGIPVEVQVSVTGQEGEAKFKKLNQFEVNVNEDNERVLTVDNSGLDTLNIYGISSEIFGFETGFNDTIQVLPNQTVEVPFNIKPNTKGVLQGTATLSCDDGEFIANLEFVSKNAPEMEAYLSQSDVTVDSEEEAEINLVIKNAGSGSMLEYNLDHLQLFNLSQGKLDKPLEYEITTSDDVDGPEMQWENIEVYANQHPEAYWYEQEMETKTNFPYFQRVMGKIYPQRSGEFAVYGPNDEGKGAYGLILPIGTLNSSQWVQVPVKYHHSFEDREVITVKGHIMKNSKVQKGTNIEYQLVMFRNGVIEYRYKEVEDYVGDSDAEYIIGFEGPTSAERIYYKSREDSTTTIHDNMVIRFTPKEPFSFTGVNGFTNGKVAAGDSVIVPLTVKPALYNVQQGSYSNNIMLLNNSAEPKKQLDFTVQVTGQEAFTAADTLSFDDVHVGQNAVRYLRVDNTGNNTGTISSVTSNNNDFTVDMPLPISINGEANAMIPVKFAPTNSGVVDSELTLHFNDGTSEKVVLLAQGDIDPEYTLDIPSELTFHLNAGEKKSLPLSITNSNKGIDLEYTFQNSIYASIENEISKMGEGSNVDSVITTYGYRWQESDSIKHFYKWNDLTMLSDVDTLYPEANGSQRLVELPFEFPFFGEKFDSIWVSQNGYISVNQPFSDRGGYPFLKDDGVNGTIAPFVTDLKPGQPGDGVLMKLEEDRIYLQWNKYVGIESNYTGGSVTFQLEIQKDGRIFFHYKNLENWGGLFQYGLESPDETEVVRIERAWILKWATIGDKETIVLTPSTKGSVSNNKKQTFEVTATAESLYQSGVFKDTLKLLTNSQQKTEIEIPITLHVTGKAKLEIRDSLYWNELIYAGEETSAEKKLRLFNTGSDKLEISHIKSVDFDKLELYDSAGNKLVKLSTGKLSQKIKIDPWEYVDLIFEVYTEEKVDIDGTVEFTGNMNKVTIPVKANVVDSPVFDWTATDQKFSLNNSDIHNYTFSIENQGETMLSYSLVPAAKGGSEGDFPGEFEEIGRMTYDDPSVITSMQLDYKEDADGVFTPLILPQPLHFATQYTAPKGGFYLTHIRSNATITAMQQYILVRVYVGGDQPGPGIVGDGKNNYHIGDRGDLAYKQKYVIDRRINKDWVIFPLEEPVFVPEGENFFLIVQYPAMPSSQGFDTALPEDPEANEYSWSALHRTWWENDSIPNEENDSIYSWGKDIHQAQLWKIRPLTASGSAQWFTLDRMSGKLGANEVVDITASFDASLAGEGDHVAKILVSSNDVNRPNDKVDIELSVNGTPELVVRPNLYKDTLSITETESAVYNYLFKDPEGESMTFHFENIDSDSITVTGEQQSGEVAKISVETNYLSAGIHNFPVEISDEAGNITRDSIVIEVMDKNRAPYLNPDYEVIYLNSADPETFSIDIKDLFIDPDGDDLAVVAGNYTPQIVDMALGRYYIDLHPLQQGVGFVVFGADDGKENGFSIFGVYVVITDDPDAVNSAPDGFGIPEEVIEEMESEMTVYPNPVTNNYTNIVYKLDEDAEVIIEIYDINGRKLLQPLRTNSKSGMYQEQIQLGELNAGLYFCRFSVNGEWIETEKIIIK